VDPATLGALLDEDLVVVDVGARWGVGERWRPFGPRVRVVGFDPDEAECDRLNAIEPDVLYVPAALGSREGPAVLHLTVEPACSSLYPPLVALPDERPELACIRPDGVASVMLTTLDRWLDDGPVDNVHVLKLDVQGAELDVLEGAEQALRTVRLLEIEVELNPMYDGQPLFGDVDRFLRARGFVLWRLGHLVHYSPAGAPHMSVADRQFFDSRLVEVEAGGGQVYWAHAYYVAADALTPGPGDRSVAVRDAVAATAFGFPDLAALRLRHVTDQPMGQTTD
jgi:FkbM family methyltransferase